MALAPPSTSACNDSPTSSYRNAVPIGTANGTVDAIATSPHAATTWCSSAVANGVVYVGTATGFSAFDLPSGTQASTRPTAAHLACDHDLAASPTRHTDRDHR